MPSHRTPRGAARNASAKIAAASGSDRCYDDEMAPPNTSRPTARHAHTTATSKYNARAHQTKRKHPHQIKGTRPAPRHVGDRLLIEQEGCLFPCETLEVVDAAQGVCLIHYLGWDDIRDEEVGRKGCAARVLPDTPEHRVLRADLEAQIRRIQRKGNQLPRGDTKLIIENKVVTVTIVETAIRQPEKGTPVATMHYITCPSDPANDGWYDQAKLRLATTSAVVGSAVPAVVEGAGRVSRGGAKKVRGISAKAHLLDERKDASLKRLGSPVDKGSPANTAVRSGRRIDGRQSTDGGAPHSGCIDLTAPLDPASASASAEDELCTWVWYWREARSKRMPHRSSHSRTNGFNSMRWVETSRAKPTGSVAEGMARSETTSFAAAWLRQHIDELKKQSSTNVFLRRNSLQVCQHVLAAALLEDGSKSALRAPKCRGELEKSSQSQQELDVDRVTTESELDMMTSVPVPLHQAEEHQPAAPQAQGRKRSTVSTTKGQAASNALVANGSETSQTGTFDMQDSHPKRVKRNRLPSEKLGTTAAARTAAIPGQANQSMAMDNIAPTQALGTSRGKPQPDRAGNSQTQLQHLSTKRTAITVSALMDSCNASPSVSSSNNTNSADVGSQHTDQHAAQPPGRQAVMEDGQQTGAERPAHPDRSWSAAEETHLAELVSKYWPMIIDEAQRDGAPISPADSPAWVRISTELGTIKAIGTAHSDAEGVTAGLDVPLHSPESCNKHWTTVAKQMQAQQDAQERQKQAQQLEQHKRQAQDQEQEQQRKVLKQRQLLIVQQRDQLHFEQQQIVFAEVHRKLLQQHAAEKQQQHLAMQQQNRQYRSAIAQQQQQLINQCGGCPSPLQQQQLQQHQQLLLLQLQQQQLQQQQVLEQQHQQQVQQHQHQQAQSQRPLTSASVAAVLAEGYPSNVIGSLRVVYPLLHKMLRESGFGSNVMPLVGCHGQLMVKVSFSFRTPTPSAVKEGEPLVFTMKGAPWLRAMLYQNGVMQDCGFSWSPTDWLDLIETLQQLSSIVQQQSLADGLREALWRRDGRRRTYFCCLLRHPFQQRQSIQGCGIRLLDQNELRQHIAKDHANPPFQRHARIMSAEMEVLRRKRLTQLSAQQNVDSATGLECNVAAGRSLEDDHAWAVSQTEELLTNKLLSENLELFRARVKALRVQAGENADEDDDCMLAYERVSIRDGTTMTKMTCPGRTRRCKHLQCFDLRAHVQEAYRKRTTWAATGGPPRDADLPGATMVTCAVSACAMEVDVADLVKDEYFAAVLRALEQQGVDVEHVDVDPSVGNWRPSPSSRSHSLDVCGIASRPKVGTSANNRSSMPDQKAVSVARNQIEGSSDGGASSQTVAPGMPDLKKEDPNAPTFYDLT